MYQKPIKRNQIVFNLATAIKFISSMAIIWLVLMLIFRAFTLSYLSFKNGLPNNFFYLLILSWSIDLIFWIKTISWLFVLFIPIFLLSPKFSIVTLKVLMILFFLGELTLSMYFTTAFVPLGADIFGYSIKDIKQTVGASGGLSLELVLAFFGIIATLVYVLFFLAKRLKMNRFFAISLPIFSIMMVYSGLSSLKDSINLPTEFANNLVDNKSEFFYDETFLHFFPNFNNSNFDEGAISSVFQYPDPTNYPFLHKEITKDVLSPFFKIKKENTPNIVFIIVEGLGRAFTNEDAYLGNFTPFIDSLSKKSLYWKNFLSQGGRTFAVLPSLMGSLPFAKNGFLELGKQMPPQLSVLNILQTNGYHTSFYYGGETEFDNMAMYLRNNHINEINDGPTFPPGYQKLPATNGFSWGYDDEALFKYFLNTQKENQDPQLSIILTVSTHNPFIINNENKYQQVFEARMNDLGFKENQKIEYRKYKNQYASILYTDNALRSFFNNYRKRTDYQNTIFLITGDHRLPEIPMITKIDRYHVPFIIYSPLLTRSASMASISTHFDVAPSLLAFLRNSYSIKTPRFSSWLGEGLDTVRSFRNIHHLPLMQNKTDLIDFIAGEYHLNGTNLFKLNANMGEDLVTDDAIKRQIQATFYQFKKRNNLIIEGKKLLPDSIINQYTIPQKN